MLGKRRRTTTENTASAGFSPTWYASAALMVAVILALVGLLIYIGVRPHSPTPAAAPPAAAPTNPGGAGTNPVPTPPTTATDPTRPAGCRTTGTDQTIPTGTPAGVSWSLAKGVAVPLSASDGPVLHTAAGVGYCYSTHPSVPFSPRPTWVVAREPPRKFSRTEMSIRRSRTSTAHRLLLNHHHQKRALTLGPSLPGFGLFRTRRHRRASPWSSALPATPERTGCLPLQWNGTRAIGG